MSIQPTYEDVNLILRLYDMRREDRLREARAWFAANFRPKTLEELQKLAPPGSEMNASFRQVTSYWEMAASFITNGVLNKELFFESGQEVLLVYERVRAILPELRAFNKNPFVLANLEAVAKEFIEWQNRRAPEAHAAFVSRVG